MSIEADATTGNGTRDFTGTVKPQGPSPATDVGRLRPAVASQVPVREVHVALPVVLEHVMAA